MSESCPGVVLIVDGDTSSSAGLKSDLASAGFVVLEAPDAPSAVAHLNSHHVDVVISELRLSGGDGLQLLDHVRKACPDTRFILATSQGTIELAVDAMKRGSTDFLTRPLSGSALLQKIREACSTGRNGHDRRTTGSAPREIASSMGQMSTFTAMPAGRTEGNADGTNGLTAVMADMERSLIEAALRRASGNQAKAAQFLRIPRTTLRDKMAKYGMVGDAARS
jgi:DNA-binding NtrC family response regulator